MKKIRKIILTAIALLTMASAQVFGMYGANSDWIDFLTDDNQFRVRLDQLGFLLGNDTIKGTFGFRNEGDAFGSLLVGNENPLPNGDATTGNHYYDFTPTISMGLAYTSSLISVGVGYNATIGTNWRRYNGKTTQEKSEKAVAHTPVFVLNAMDNAFRMAVPIQVVHLTDKFDGGGKGSLTAVSFDAQFRYYSGMDLIPELRLHLKYGSFSGEYTPNGGTKTKSKIAESFGFEFRLYFGTIVEEVEVNPFIKLAYDGALGKQHNITAVTALDALYDAANGMQGLQNSTFPTSLGETTIESTYGQSAWSLELMPALGLTANSDIVSLYLEPSLGLTITQAGSPTEKVKEVYDLGYNVYAELYITPIQNLEWYFEAEIGNVGTGPSITKALTFNGTTGITWYLPAL